MHFPATIHFAEDVELFYFELMASNSIANGCNDDNDFRFLIWIEKSGQQTVFLETLTQRSLNFLEVQEDEQQSRRSNQACSFDDDKILTSWLGTLSSVTSVLLLHVRSIACASKLCAWDCVAAYWFLTSIFHPQQALASFFVLSPEFPRIKRKADLAGRLFNTMLHDASCSRPAASACPIEQLLLLLYFSPVFLEF